MRTVFLREELSAILRALAYMAPADATRPGYLTALNGVALALDLPAVAPEDLAPLQPGSARVQIKARHNHPAWTADS